MKRTKIFALFLILNTELVFADCSDLALMFSQSPDSMELNELGSLKTCVSDKLKARLFSGSSVTVPVPAPASDPVPMPAPPIMPASPGQ